MIRYLLDTNAVSDAMSDPLGKVAQRLNLLDEGEACTSIIVVAELRFGAVKRRSSRLSARIDAMLRIMPMMAFGPPAQLNYAELRTALEAAGSPISNNDMLIAAHALALNCILVTDNESEFRRVPGLVVENWLRDVGPVPS